MNDMTSSGTKRNNQATIRDVASKALVSVGTASRVLNNHPNVEADLRMRVLSAAQELGYSLPRRRDGNSHFDQPALTSTSVRVVETETPTISHIAFCCRPVISPNIPATSNPYFSFVLRGVEAECRLRNLHLIYRIIQDDVRDLEHGRQMLAESHADALLLINFIDERLVSGLLDLNLPTVLVDHYFPNLPLDVVTNENYNGAVRAVQHMIEKGHRRIGFVSGLPHYTVQRRFEGYRYALEAAGIPYDPALVIPCDLTFDGGLAAAEEVIRRGLNCTAYFCANDWSAIGFIQRLRSHGIQAPHDISVVGFDDAESARMISPALTTVRADPEGVGRMAVRKLLERVRHPSLPVTQTLLYTSLVERESVRDLKK